MGHKLELPIGLDWMRDVNKKKLFPGFNVISLHKVGLVGKKITLGLKIQLIFSHLYVTRMNQPFNYGVLKLRAARQVQQLIKRRSTLVNYEG